MILKLYKIAIEYPIPESITEGHKFWDMYWKCSLHRFFFLKFLLWEHRE